MVSEYLYTCMVHSNNEFEFEFIYMPLSLLNYRPICIVVVITKNSDYRATCTKVSLLAKKNHLRPAAG